MYAKRAEIYVTEYQETRDIAFLKALVCCPLAQVLEAPCGAGRLAVHLAGCVDHYTVLDCEERMLAITCKQLRQKVPQAGISAYLGDLTNLSTTARFDWIIVPREGLQLLKPSQVKQALKNFCCHLKQPFGKLILDLSASSEIGDPDYFYAHSNTDIWKKNWTRNIPSGGRLTRWSYQRETAEKIDFFFEYHWHTAAQQSQQFSAQMCLFKYQTDFIESCLPAGFQVQKLWGNYLRKSWKKNDPRLIFEIGKSET